MMAREGQRETTPIAETPAARESGQPACGLTPLTPAEEGRLTGKSVALAGRATPARGRQACVARTEVRAPPGGGSVPEAAANRTFSPSPRILVDGTFASPTCAGEIA